MIELGIVLIMAGLMAWREYNYRRENAKLINALISKNAGEARDLELADKTTIKIKPNKENEDLVAVDQLTDREWYETEIKNG